MANKRKRKNKAPHVRTAAPAERRQLISYDDVEENAAPPVPRQKVSYGSDSNSDNEQDADHTADQRHAVVSREALKERERPQTDVTYGQMSAFPGLDAREKEPFYGPANDGLDYLRMVRSEARGIPHIVTAPPPHVSHSDQDQDDDDYDGHYDDYDGYDHDDDDAYYEAQESEDQAQYGWYEDGAYVAPSIAAPVIGPVRPGMHPQDAFYSALKTRFEKLRSNLRASPSVQAVQSLDDHHPISLPYGNRAAEKEWKTHLLHTIPLPAQLASLDSQSVLRLLKLAEGQLENCRSSNIPHNLSLWIWALLAKLEDVGLLQTRDVSVVRDLAKMAVWVRMMHHKAKYGRSDDPEHDYLDRYPQENASHQDDDKDAAEHHTTAGAPKVEDVTTAQNKDDMTTGDQEGDAAMELDSSDELSDLIAAKKRQLQAEEVREKENENEQDSKQEQEQEKEKEQEQQEFPDVNTCVTIDMLVTVAAEFYGQKDLLVGRIPWDSQQGD